MKRSGVLARETLTGLRRYSRKFGYWPSRDDVWHLLDTIDAQRLVIDRLTAGWSIPVSEHDDLYGWWVDDWYDSQRGSRSPEEMTQAEQLVVYDRIVRPEAPKWPELK